MRIIKARQLNNVTVEFKDTIDNLKFLILHKDYYSSFYYEFSSKDNK